MLNDKTSEINDIIKIKTNIVLYDKDGNVIKVETPKPEIIEKL